ncbi:MAG TPA: hypothetical protein VFV50_18400, partial [Bdellovibrionales bacterium]|nr:hypothetical protein [Bdellovibrionales bacterium]
MQELARASEPKRPIETKSEAGKSDDLKTMAYYAQRLRAEMPASYFEPARIRLLWFVGYVAVSFGALWLIGNLNSLLPAANWVLTWPLKALLGVVVGICSGALGF